VEHFLESILLSEHDKEAAHAARLHLNDLLQSQGGGDRASVSQAEQTVKNDPHKAFEFDASGSATLHCGPESWKAGQFETPTISSLEDKLGVPTPNELGSLKLSVIEGVSPLSDIGWLQASSPPHALFQVASQFNCLESPGPYVVPVQDYFKDATQGPRAAIGAFPATLLRHYSTPDQSAPDQENLRFTQVTNERQVDLLATACGANMARNGYLTGRDIKHRESFADTLESNWRALRVGVHDQVQVVLGYNWDGGPVSPEAPTIGQVFTSTVAGGDYHARLNLGDRVFERVARKLLRAAYLGTLLASVLLKKDWVVLTLIGGGAFQNPPALIWDSIVWALERVAPILRQDMHVVLNARNLSHSLDFKSTVLPEVQGRAGRVCFLDTEGLQGRLE